MLFIITFKSEHYPRTSNYILRISKNGKQIAKNVEVSDGKIPV